MDRVWDHCVRSAARSALRCVYGFLMVLLPACSMAPVQPLEVAKNTLAMNQAVEENEDQVTLLNIVRGYLREPRFYTDFTDFKEGLPTTSSTLKLSATPEFDIAGQSASPSIDVAPTHSQAFIRGITTPVSPQTVAYYSGQEWPNSLLLHLFVREVRVYDANDVLLKTYSNYPQQTEGYDQFDALINALSACDLTAGQVDGGDAEAVGPPIPRDEVATVKGESAVAATSNLKLAPSPASVAAPTQFLLLKQKAQQASLSFLPHGTDALKAICLSAYDMAGVPRPAPDKYTPGVKAPDKKAKAKTSHMALLLRSPEALMYYIGETTRVALDGPYPRSTKAANGTVQSVAGAIPAQARRIGILHFSDACMYEPAGVGDCTTTCADLFAMSVSPQPQPATSPPGYCMLPPAPGATGLQLHCVADKAAVQKDGDPMNDCAAESEPAAYAGRAKPLSVSYAGSTYSITGNSEGGTETLHTLYFVEQLIELQASATDNPGTNPVPVGP